MAYTIQCPQSGRAGWVCHFWNQLGNSFQKAQESLYGEVMITIIIIVFCFVFE